MYTERLLGFVLSARDLAVSQAGEKPALSGTLHKSRRSPIIKNKSIQNMPSGENCYEL